MTKHYLSLKEQLYVISISLLRSLKLLTRFKVSFLFTLISTLFNIAIFFFVSQFVNFENYFEYVLIGLAINQYATLSITTFLSSIRMTYWSNRLELIISSPARLKTYFISTLLFSFIYATITIIVYFVVGIYLFGAQITFPVNIHLIILFLFLVVVSLSGIGLISASMFLLLNAKGEVEPISWFLTTISGVFAGVYFPISQLPHGLQIISNILPQTHALKAIRLIFEGHGIENTEIQSIILILLVFIIILIPLGLWIFKQGIKKAEKEGTLARWA